MKDKTVLITGASSGVGAALATVLAAGNTLRLLGRNQERLDKCALAVRAAGGEAHPSAFDLTDDEAVRTFAATIKSLDILIHSAGVVSLGQVAEAPVSAFDEQYRVNLRAPLMLTQALLPSLKAARGQIVFINSGAGLRANANWSQYAASKHGLKALADSLRAEVNPDVRVLSVYPGRTDSPMQREVRTQENGPYERARYLQPEDIAKQVLAALELPERAQITDLPIRPL